MGGPELKRRGACFVKYMTGVYVLQPVSPLEFLYPMYPGDGPPASPYTGGTVCQVSMGCPGRCRLFCGFIGGRSFCVSRNVLKKIFQPNASPGYMLSYPFGTPGLIVFYFCNSLLLSQLIYTPSGEHWVFLSKRRFFLWKSFSTVFILSSTEKRIPWLEFSSSTYRKP